MQREKKASKLSDFAFWAIYLWDQCVLQHMSSKIYIPADVETEASANDFGL